MIRTLHCVWIAFFLALTHLSMLLHVPMLGCGFSGSGAGNVPDDMDDRNSYVCNCRCDTPTRTTLRVTSAADDAEQTIATGAVVVDDVDLDLGVDRAGLRFAGVLIPNGFAITAAHLQLTADQVFMDDGASPTNLTIFGEAADDAAPFSPTPFNLTARAQTVATVAWSPPPWSLSESGSAERSPDLKDIIQEIISRPGWRSIFGARSLCEIEGQATVRVGDEEKVTDAEGTLEIIGEPCPEGSCAVSIDYLFALDPIKFEVKFASDPVFEDLAATGSSTPAGVEVGPAGIGEVLPESTESSIRGRRGSNDAAFVLTNDTSVGLIVNWEDHVCALFGELATTVDSEDPNVDTDEALAAEIHLQGPIVNEPPKADAGPDHGVECASSQGAAVVLDGVASTDPEDNIVAFQWFRGSRSGEVLGTEQVVRVPQMLGVTSTYVLRVMDAYAQTSEDPIVIGVADTTAPQIDCNAPPTITPPDTPVEFTATSEDACDPEVIPEIIGFECFRFAGNGTRVDKTHSCGVTFAGNVISIPHSLGVGNHITWTVRAEDESGNVRELECGVEVVRRMDG